METRRVFLRERCDCSGALTRRRRFLFGASAPDGLGILPLARIVRLSAVCGFLLALPALSGRTFALEPDRNPPVLFPTGGSGPPITPAPCTTWVAGGPSGYFVPQGSICFSATWAFDEIQTSKCGSGILDSYVVPILARSTAPGASPLGTVFLIATQLWDVTADGLCKPLAMIPGSDCTHAGTVDLDGSPPHNFLCDPPAGVPLPNNSGNLNKCEIDFFLATKMSEDGAGWIVAGSEQIIGGNDPATIFNQNQVWLEDCPPTGVFTSTSFDAPGIVTDFADATVCEVATFNPFNACPPPSSTPVSAKVYRFVGLPNGVNGAWCLREPCCFYAKDLNVPGASMMADLTINIVASINSLGCANLVAVVLGPPSAGRFKITADTCGGTLEFRVGSGGAMSCDALSVVAPSGNVNIPGAYNPDVFEIPLSGFDCNGNGEDDLIDILGGTSLDADRNGIPDECGVVPTVSEWGLVVLTLLLLSSIALKFGRRRAALP